MTDLIPIERTEDGALVVSSTTIAENAQVQHKNVLELIRNSLPDLEEFGQVAFETRPGYNGSKVQVAQLNEQQATLSLTYMRNTPPVRTFKKNLVHAFYAMAQALPAARELTEDEIVHQALAITSRKVQALEATLEQQREPMEYHERFIAEQDDIITVDNFASQYGATGPKVRDLLRDRGVAIRRTVGKRWSESKRRMEDVYEWRARQGVESAEWFDLRPQHNAPRLHNGQVKQTLYVRQYHAQKLAEKLGVAQLVIPEEAA